MTAASDQAAVDAARTLLAHAAARLAAGGAPQEALAEFRPATRRFGLPRAARMVSLGRVWRLGVLLLDAGGDVRATGRITRAVEAGHRRYGAVSTEERREVRAAAHRGPFAEGETVVYDAPLVDLTPASLAGGTGPLLLRDDRVLVRWSVSTGDDAARDLAAYLDERIDLLLHPPQGA